jgi:hypothetical protein
VKKGTLVDAKILECSHGAKDAANGSNIQELDAVQLQVRQRSTPVHKSSNCEVSDFAHIGKNHFYRRVDLQSLVIVSYPSA